MNTYAVWTEVGGNDTPLGYQGGVSALIASGLTLTQAKNIVEHLRTYHGDYNVKAVQE